MPPEAPPPPGLLCHMVFTDGLFHVMWLPVSIKTFSTHVVVKIHPVVRKSGVFTHEKVLRGQSHQNAITHRQAFGIVPISKSAQRDFWY